MTLPSLDLSRIVAIVCAIALMGAWTFGMASRPKLGEGAGNALKPVDAFTPPAGYVGSHLYGLWTLTCSQASNEPAAPGTDIPRCRTQGMINARRPDRSLVSLVAIRVVRAGPQDAPYLVMFLPAKSKGDGAVLFAVDGNNAFRAPIKECTPTTCKIEAPLPEQALTQMLSGGVLKLQFGGASGTKLVYPLHGFRESFEALTTAELPG